MPGPELVSAHCDRTRLPSTFEEYLKFSGPVSGAAGRAAGRAASTTTRHFQAHNNINRRRSRCSSARFLRGQPLAGSDGALGSQREPVAQPEQARHQPHKDKAAGKDAGVRKDRPRLIRVQELRAPAARKACQTAL